MRDVIRYVQANDNSLGVVPIENSSGGIIHDTVDEFVKDSFGLYIQEELGIHVRLAFLGPRTDEPIQTIYSHWAALKHCEAWIEENHPGAKTIAVRSTSEAAQIAAQDSHAAAISTRDAGHRFGLRVLVFPIIENVPNATQFFTVGKNPANNGDSAETSLVVTLKDGVGALYAYLEPYNTYQVNLKRITSRNVPGCASQSKFFVGIEGSDAEERVRNALAVAEKIAARTRLLGSYPRRATLYES